MSGVQVALIFWRFDEERLINRDKSGIHSRTWTLQYRSDDNVENKQIMRRQWETAETSRFEFFKNARLDISHIISLADIER